MSFCFLCSFFQQENPAPGEVVGDPAAQGGSDGRREHDGDAVDGESLAALVRRVAGRVRVDASLFRQGQEDIFNRLGPIPVSAS